MDLYKILQLIKRHLFLLIIIPFIMAVLVFLFTRNRPKAYSSETKVYTGIAGGYNLESTERRMMDYAATNVKFDDLIQTINSNRNKSRTAIRLLVQHLILEAPVKQYISRDNYYAIHRIVPKHIHNLVYKNGKMGAERELEEEILKNQQEIAALEKKIAQKQGRFNNRNFQKPFDDSQFTSHVVRPGESFQSIANMYDISEGELLSKNNLNNRNIRIGDTLIIRKDIKTRFVYHTVKENETLFAIANYYNVSITDLRRINKLYSDKVTPGLTLIIRDLTGNPGNLISDNMSAKNKDLYLSETSLSLLDQLTPVEFSKDPIVPEGIKKSDFEATFDNFLAEYNSSDTNFVYQYLHYPNKYYGIGQIGNNLQVNRINNSDHVRVRYQADDPGICQQTLKILTREFIHNYQSIHLKQTDDVVAELQKRVDDAYARLVAAEDKLLAFNVDNNIINYYEQSKYTAEKYEELELLYQNEQVKYASARGSLDLLETKLMGRDSIYVKSDLIEKKMQDLTRVKGLIIINELDVENNPHMGNRLTEMRLEADRLMDEMKAQVDQLYLYQYSSEGIPIKELLTEYLNNNIAMRVAGESLKVLRSRRKDFTRKYQVFAPLGAQLKRIEREISVLEREYLQNFNALEQAKLKRQNNLLSSKIKVVDEPEFPLQANPSKTKLLIIAAAAIGFLIVAFVILMLEFFDTTVKNPDAVEKQTKLKLAGAYPILEPGIDNSYIRNRLIELILQNIKMYINHSSVYTSEKPYLILVFSTQIGVGKTLIATELINKLRSWGEKVLYLNYSTEDTEEDTDADALDNTIHYKIDHRFVEIKHINELLASNYLREDNYKYDYIFLEIPALIYNSYPLELMNSVDVALMVTKAQSQWRRADITALEIMQEVSREKPMVVLNQTELYALEDIVNDIPEKKHRSLRRKVKKIVTYPFKLKLRVRVD